MYDGVTDTLWRIAQEAGVSSRTVSRVLSGETRGARPSGAVRAERIRRIADRHGYMPNTAARAVRAGRFGAIGLLTSTDPVAGALPYGAFQAIQRAMLQSDWHLVVGQVPDLRLGKEGFVPKLLREWAVDGLLISYTIDPPASFVQFVETHRVPSIWINTKQESNCVFPDDYGAVRALTERVIQQGHRRIAYMGPESFKHYSSADRKAGYVSAMESAGLTPDIVPNGKEFDGRRHQLIAQVLRASKRPTTVVAYDGGTARAILYAAATLGIKIPGDVSLVSVVADSESFFGVHVDGVLLPTETMGSTAMELLTQRIECPERVLPPVALPCALREGETLAPVRQRGRKVTEPRALNPGVSG